MLAEEYDTVSRLFFKPEWGIIVKEERPDSADVAETDVELGGIYPQDLKTELSDFFKEVKINAVDKQVFVKADVIW